MNSYWKILIRYRLQIVSAAISASSAVLLANTLHAPTGHVNLNKSSGVLIETYKCLSNNLNKSSGVFFETNKCLSSILKPCELLGIMPKYHASCKDSSHNEFIADAAEQAMPSVVSIEVSSNTHNLSLIEEGHGSGSGFIVNSDLGYIITNEHVVSGTGKVTVVLKNGSHLQGSVVAIDGKTDLALVKVETSLDLPQIKMGDESVLRPGQWVIAIGNSLQFPNTVTAGVVSGLARNLSDHKLFSMNNANQHKIANSTFVQTDTTINPGNSGGPLVNLDGEVIAVNTLTLFGMARGISFSIPISEVKRFLHQFSEGGLSSNSGKSNFVLGIKMISMSPEMTRFLHHNGQLDRSVPGFSC